MKTLAALAALCAAFAAFFLIFPETDIWASSLFFRDGKFYLADKPLPVFVFEAVYALTAVLAAALVGLLAHGLYRKQNSRRVLFLLLSLAIGPGLIVNAVFKDNWGRARPAQITQFGGQKTFTPPFVISDSCARNCSFPSGHASMGFFIASFAYAVTKRRNKTAFYASGIISGFGIGLVRIIQGGHFLSDVIFAGFFVLITCHCLSLFLFPERKRQLPG